MHAGCVFHTCILPVEGKNVVLSIVSAVECMSMVGWLLCLTFSCHLDEQGYACVYRQGHALLQWQVCHAKKKRRRRKKGKADLTTVLHIRELPHLHMELAVWFSFPTTNNKNPMIPSWSLVSIYNYSFNPDQIFTKNFEILELEICSKTFTCGMLFLQVNSSLPTSLKKYVLSH